MQVQTYTQRQLQWELERRRDSDELARRKGLRLWTPKQEAEYWQRQEALGILGGCAAAALSMPASTWTPLSITSVPVLQWSRSDFGVTVTPDGGGVGIDTVAAWADQSGNGRHWAQATTSKQPRYTALDGTIGRPSIAFDGIDDALVIPGWDLPAPSVTPLFVWLVIKQLSWTTAETIIGAQANAVIIQQSGSTPSVRQFNGAAGLASTGLPIGSWGRVHALFSNSVADTFRAGNASATGTATGNNDPSAGAVSLGSRSTGATAFCNVTFLETLLTAGVPSELAALEAYGASLYPTAVF